MSVKPDEIGCIYNDDPVHNQYVWRDMATKLFFRTIVRIAIMINSTIAIILGVAGITF